MDWTDKLVQDLIDEYKEYFVNLSLIFQQVYDVQHFAEERVTLMSLKEYDFSGL